MPRNAAMQNHIVCNSDESEPGTCKDATSALHPHAVIEGMHRRLHHRRDGSGYNVSAR